MASSESDSRRAPRKPRPAGRRGPTADLQHAFEHAASDMAASVRVPGFRQGKAPMAVVVARVGREAVWQEALKSHLDSWFWSAAEDSGIRPVSSPEVEFEGLPEDDEPFKFSATVAVLPKPEIADWTELEVPAAEPEVPAELVDNELERIRETVAELVPVDGRPVQAGDTLVIDITGEGLPAQRDFVVEVGAGWLRPSSTRPLSPCPRGARRGRAGGGRVEAGGRAHGQGDQGERAARARRRAREGGHRIRHPGRSARRSRGAVTRTARGGAPPSPSAKLRSTRS